MITEIFRPTDYVMQLFSAYTWLALLFLPLGLSAQLSQDQLDYIDRYKDIAIKEMERAGIPASIKLAQGILESDAGKSYLARNGNNHFGIKCGSDWNGKKVYRKDDDYDEEGRLIESCFRGYRTPEAAYIAHSEFLRDPRKAFRYGFLFRLDPTDYKRWAQGLKQAGYATSATYPEKLISLIERYELYQYDRISIIDIDEPSDVLEAGILTAGISQNNDVKYFISDESLRVEDIAKLVDVSAQRIIRYNENIEGEDQELSSGTRVYLQPKRNSYRGREIMHEVQPGETMFQISQRYGIKLRSLLRRNRLEPGEEPRSGEDIKLRGSRVSQKPRTLRPGEVETPPAQPAEPTQPATDTDDQIDFDDEDDFPAPPTGQPTPDPTTPTPDKPDNSGTVSPRPDGRPITPTGDPVNPTPVPTNPPITSPVNPQPGTNPPPTNPTNPINPTNPTIDPVPVPTPPIDIDNEPDFNPPVTSPVNPGPVTNPPAVDRPTTNPTPPASQAQYHTVAAGETLYAISRRYGLTVDRLKELNNLTGNIISVGQRLRVK
jgi:LysM repeat protein